MSSENNPLRRPEKVWSPVSPRVILASFVIILAVTAFSLRLSSFLHAKEAILCLALAPLAWFGGIALSRRVLVPYVPVVATGLVGVAGAWYSGAPPVAFTPELLRIVLLLVAAFCITAGLRCPEECNVIRAAFAFSGILAAALAILQHFQIVEFWLPPFPHYTQSMYSVFGNQDALGGFIAMVIPLLLFPLLKDLPSRNYVGWAIAGLVVLVVTLVLTECRSAWIAAIVGVGVATLPRFRQHRVRVALILGIVLLTTVVTLFRSDGPAQKALGSLENTDVGVQARIWFWEGSLKMISDRPWLGGGIGSFAWWSPRYLGMAAEDPHRFSPYHNEVHTLHAHSDAFEVVATCGIAGLVVLIVLSAAILPRPLAYSPDWSVLAAGLVYSLFNPLWSQSAHALLLLISWGFCFPHPRCMPLPGLRQRWMAVFSAVLIGLSYGGVVVFPGYLLTRAEAAHLAGGEGAPVEASYESALAWTLFPSEALRSRGVLRFEQGRYEDAARDFERALAGLDTGEIHWFLAQARQRAGDMAGAAAARRDCLERWPWFEAATLSSTNPVSANLERPAPTAPRR